MTRLSQQIDRALAADESATWHPRVGDAVRIVLQERRFCQEAPHFACELGRTGRIIRSRPVGSAPTHPYLVMLDRPEPDASPGRLDLAITARHYAAEELQPLAS
jgi:hypothetical protein